MPPRARADMNWFAVLAHHAAPHRPTSRSRCSRARPRPTARWPSGPSLWPAACADAASVVATSWLSSPTTAPSSWRRSSPPTTSERSPCPSTGGWPRPRCATSSSTPVPAPSCATNRSSIWPTTRRRAPNATLARVCVSPVLADRMDDPGRSADQLPQGGARPRGGRRRPPSHVHVGHHGTTQGRHDHPRQPGVEEPGAHRRVRLHERRPRARLRAPLPRRSARPHDHVADRRRRDDHHPPGLRRHRTWSTSSSGRG